MIELLRDTVVGHLLRWISHGQVDGQAALKFQSEGPQTAWNDVELQAGSKKPENTAAKPPAKPVHQVVVWYDQTDQEVSEKRLPNDPANIQ